MTTDGLFTVYFPESQPYMDSSRWLKERGWVYRASSFGFGHAYRWQFNVYAVGEPQSPPKPVSWFRRNVIWKIKALILILLCGCATFVTEQTDTSYDENGAQVRTITTKAKSRTFFEAKSSLAQFKAMQTDKTQSATVGSLGQQADTTNSVILIERVVGAAVKAAIMP